MGSASGGKFFNLSTPSFFSFSVHLWRASEHASYRMVEAEMGTPLRWTHRSRAQFEHFLEDISLLSKISKSHYWKHKRWPRWESFPGLIWYNGNALSCILLHFLQMVVKQRPLLRNANSLICNLPRSFYCSLRIPQIWSLRPKVPPPSTLNKLPEVSFRPDFLFKGMRGTQTLLLPKFTN